MSNIISLSAFPKSGVTYLSFLLFQCFFGSNGNLHDIEREYVIDIHAYPKAVFPEPRTPKLVKSHFAYNADLPSVQATNKAIYLIRHPIDVMMSAWDFGHLVAGSVREERSEAFQAFVRKWLETGGTAFPEYGSWVDHVHSWLDQVDIPIHLVRYEDLVDRPQQELPRILKFMNIDVPLTQQNIAIQRSSMKSMAAVEAEEIQKKIDGPFFNQSLVAGLGLGHRFVNKGYRDSYAKILSDDERALADRTFGSTIARFLA